MHTMDLVPSYIAQEPDGSQADDAVINPATTIECAIAILNDELYWNHSVSLKLVLHFEDP